MATKKKHTNSLKQPATKGDVEDVIKELRSEMRDMTEGIIQHFYTVAEKIHRDVAGANRDEISAIQDKIQQHDTDIAVIKQKVEIN